MEPAIYSGTVRHRRFRPARHEFTYELFMAFLDIDRIPEIMAQSAVSSYNGWNWASFHQSDHFGDPKLPLRERLRRDAEARGVDFPHDGPIFLLTHLRYLGYCFNPISLYYCYDRAGGPPQAILAEVNSTFGEHRNYWLGSHNRLPGNLKFHSVKTMHVSPFMDMNLEYEFAFKEPGEQLVAHMNTIEAQRIRPGGSPMTAEHSTPVPSCAKPTEDGATFFDATLTLTRKPWTSANLTAALAKQPWMTAKVIAAIHWEALRLWMKRVPVFEHPAGR